ncbi:31275_t:CDS:2 [Gigaspora margarita]|uniref:31275_t:CDS:1 n=1 Tax=Gigaspora margarita TaxID=4874 RepID=A0ABM8W1D2_GIGMA|nr:31275_t:CDS:2 [Gigaspora margarita]
MWEELQNWVEEIELKRDKIKAIRTERKKDISKLQAEKKITADNFTSYKNLTEKILEACQGNLPKTEELKVFEKKQKFINIYIGRIALLTLRRVPKLEDKRIPKNSVPSPYELVCENCGKIIEIVLSFETIQKYTCSCEVEKYIKKEGIVGATIQNSTTLTFRYNTGKVVTVEVQGEQLEMVRDYYKDKYQNEIAAKQQEELAEIERLRTENIYGLTTKHII